MGSTACTYRTSEPVQRCILPLPIPLLPLCAVRPVQNLSACTTLYFTFTSTSTPPMCRTACIEPQFLYNGALYLYLYLYSPYVPYGLYRASVPVQRCTLPLPLPLTKLYMAINFARSCLRHIAQSGLSKGKGY